MSFQLKVILQDSVIAEDLKVGNLQQQQHVQLIWYALL